MRTSRALRRRREASGRRIATGRTETSIGAQAEIMRHARQADHFRPFSLWKLIALRVRSEASAVREAPDPAALLAAVIRRQAAAIGPPPGAAVAGAGVVRRWRRRLCCSVLTDARCRNWIARRVAIRMSEQQGDLLRHGVDAAALREVSEISKCGHYDVGSLIQAYRSRDF